jgi:MFS transporter, ACS family, D-galactonate transporter
VAPKDTATETPKSAWKVTFLLFLFMLVNFADKIVVGLAGGPIMDKLMINPQHFGDLGSSFFYLFSISAIIVKNCSKLGCRPPVCRCS